MRQVDSTTSILAIGQAHSQKTRILPAVFLGALVSSPRWGREWGPINPLIITSSPEPISQKRVVAHHNSSNNSKILWKQYNGEDNGGKLLTAP
jgi:hypothetical protein